MARCMLSTAKLEDQFWAEAVQTAVYLLNRAPTKILQNRTPEEVWTGRKPSIHHLRVFGCTAYMHVPDEKRKKIDPKTLPCLFLGYSTTSKAYRLMDPETKKIYESRDV
ncbi:hypothetical protein KI387_042034, partial [Taxus chinensis]